MLKSSLAFPCDSTDNDDCSDAEKQMHINGDITAVTQINNAFVSPLPNRNNCAFLLMIKIKSRGSCSSFLCQPTQCAGHCSKTNNMWSTLEECLKL